MTLCSKGSAQKMRPRIATPANRRSVRGLRGTRQRAASYRGDVAIPLRQDNVIAMRDVECLSDLLLVRASVVAATHELFGGIRLQNLQFLSFILIHIDVAVRNRDTDERGSIKEFGSFHPRFHRAALGGRSSLRVAHSLFGAAPITNSSVPPAAISLCRIHARDSGFPFNFAL
jgi:hypothetical protein